MAETATVIIMSIVAVLLLLSAYIIGNKVGAAQKEKVWQAALPAHRKEAITKSRAVLSGHFSEQLAPFLPDFSYAPTECKFLGKPIDLLVFQGMDEKNITEVIFVEVKSGSSKLSPIERNLKAAIEEKRVSWQEYRIPETLTKRDVPTTELHEQSRNKEKKNEQEKRER